jgi:hypothetical protein
MSADLGRGGGFDPWAIREVYVISFVGVWSMCAQRTTVRCSGRRVPSRS